MAAFQFETVDVFTERRFGGNPLAVFTDARGLTEADMQSLAAELNLSETTFVLPPDKPGNTARVRIFNRTAEMPFAGHPSIGTAYVLARRGQPRDGKLRLELLAGIVPVEIEVDPNGCPAGASIEAPQPLSLGRTIPAATVADCLGLSVRDIKTDSHEPVIASVGNPYVIAELHAAALRRCEPRIEAFRRASDSLPDLHGRFSLHVYCREGLELRARMFAPLAGTWEDPATGSANAPLGALLLALGRDECLRLRVHQGVEMGRPSLLIVEARRSGANILATVAGRCVPIFTGSFELSVGHAAG